METQFLIEEYVSGKSPYQIAKEQNLSSSSIWNIIKKSGIKTRSKKEAAEKYAKYDDCIICGSRFRVRSDWLHGNHYRKTCSPDCEKEYKSKRIKETYTDERKARMSEKLKGREITWHVKKGSECAGWKGGYTSSSYRRIAFEEIELEVVCSNCGSTKNLVIHHKDRDRTHNTKDNLEVLCKSCHTSYHAKKGDCGWKFQASKREPRITLDQIVLGLNEGKSIRALEREYKTSHTTINEILSENNIKNPRKR